MTEKEYLAAVDIGTTSIKMGIFDTSDLDLKVLCTEDIAMDINGEEAVQYPDEWWDVICHGISGLVKDLGAPVESIKSISFCSQTGSFIPIDESGTLLFDSLNCIDGRGIEEYRKGMTKGIKIEGINARKILACIRENKAGPASHKDFIWKYLWFKNNKPELYGQTYKCLDVNSYMLYRCTGKMAISFDSAFVYLLPNIKTAQWSEKLCRMFGVDINHLPDMYYSTDPVGCLTKESAEALGLSENVVVYAGGGDMSMIHLGSGALAEGERHIYGGSSAWIGTAMNRQIVDISSMMVGIPGAFKGFYNYLAELEVAGTSLEWAIVDILKEGFDILDSKDSFSTPGANGVVFTPWINGIRAPKQDPDASGSLRNVKLGTSRYDICRAIIEGIAFHVRWMSEASDRKTKHADEAYFVGGMARSDLICQIMADITGSRIMVPYNPQQAGLYGVAMCSMAGKMGIKDITELKKYVRIERTFEPNPDYKELYDKCFERFVDIYERTSREPILKLDRYLNVIKEVEIPGFERSKNTAP